MPNIHNIPLLFVFAALSLGSTIVHAQSPISLQGHRAVYDIELLEAKPSASVISVKGELDFELSYDCEGWATSYTFDVAYNFVNQPTSRIITKTTTYEDVGSQRYDFSLTREMIGRIVAQVAGHAEKGDDGLNVSYLRPERDSAVYEEAALLPSEHTIEILTQAKAGKRFASHKVFDGLDQKGIMDVTTIIGTYKSDGDYNNGPETIEGLNVSEDVWRINMGYFSADNSEGISDYEISGTLYESGVLDDVRLDYHDYVVGQELRSIEMHEAPKCQ